MAHTARNFYPRSPCGERRGAYRGARQSRRHFYPRSPCGERLYHNNTRLSNHTFLSTLSLRRATTGRQSPAVGVPYFYPRSPCGERQEKASSGKLTFTISIHALLAESDLQSLLLKVGIFYFYPRSPCGERHGLVWLVLQIPYFYPRSPCGERPANALPITSPITFLSTLSLRRATIPNNGTLRNTHISIHALLAESDC